MLWLALAVMTAIAGGAVLLPYLRGRTPPPPRAAYDLEVYRDQLAEIERDRTRGLIDDSEAKAARLEIARRALAADAAAKEPASVMTSGHEPAPRKSRPDRRMPVLALIAAGAAPLAALAVYLAIGAPELPSHDFNFMAAHVETGQKDAELVAKLEAQLKANPDDLQGWLLLARSYDALGRMDDAVKAWREAIQRAPHPAELASRFGEALVDAAGGTVTPEAQARFQAGLAADPLDARARYYLGLAKAQAGESRAALQDWTDLVAISPPNAPWLPTVHNAIQRVAGEAKIDPASLTASPEAQKLAHEAQAQAQAQTTPAAPGPSMADVGAMQNMSPEQRQAMIHGMVDKLAAELQANPNDVDGWLRLGRARHVLGQEDQSIQAYAKAAALAPNRLDAQTAYADALFGQLKPGQKPQPTFIALMRHILDLDATNGDALWFVGLAEAEAGHRETAAALWQRLLAEIPPDQPKARNAVQGAIDKLKQKKN
jgi:cytochrome c-type biogenesis protein CcmH